MNAPCENLDAYLADDLLVDAAAAFEEHLECCDECRDAVAEQGWIEALLRSPERLEVEAAPRHLVETTKLQVAGGARQRRRWAAGAFAAAASVVIALGWIAIQPRSSDNDADDRAATPTASKPAPEAVPPTSTFIADANAIAIPMVSKHPNITIVRVYPTLRPLVSDGSASSEPEDESEFASTDFSNGG